LYRYSSNKIYYAVFRSDGKLIWKSLQTDDRELANRKLKAELEKHGKTNPAARGMTLAPLLRSRIIWRRSRSDKLRANFKASRNRLLTHPLA